MRRLRTGVVGCGLIAQLMHLPHLRELAERFEVTALCDLSPRALSAAGAAFPNARRFERWPDLVGEPLDVVMVLTPGSHAPIALAVMEAGLHVFVEKPLAFSAEEARAMVDAAERARVLLMVGYMKRYDPAYEELARRLDGVEVRLARITTLEAPAEPYVAHHQVARASDVDEGVLADLRAEDERRVEAAVGTADPVVHRAYRVVLESMVHELNGVRGLLGEPTGLRFANVWAGGGGVTATLSFGQTECVFLWIDLPGAARYEQDWSFYAADRRLSLIFPSPYLRHMPTRLVLEGGEPGSPQSCRTTVTVSYEEAFKLELIELHECIVRGRNPRTDARDGLRDVLLAEAIVRSSLEGRAVPSPTRLDG